VSAAALPGEEGINCLEAARQQQARPAETVECIIRSDQHRAADEFEAAQPQSAAPPCLPGAKSTFASTTPAMQCGGRWPRPWSQHDMGRKRIPCRILALPIVARITRSWLPVLSS